MKLVPNWRSAWRWVSVQLAVTGVALQAAVMAFPSLKDWLGDTTTHLVGILMLLGIALGRMVEQKKQP